MISLMFLVRNHIDNVRNPICAADIKAEAMVTFLALDIQLAAIGLALCLV